LCDRSVITTPGAHCSGYGRGSHVIAARDRHGDWPENISDLAAFANGTMIRYLDFNDTYLNGGHPSDMLAPVLACAEVTKGGGQDVIHGFVLAYEVYGGLRQSRAGVRRDLPTWDQATYAVVAAATAAGKILGLDREQMGHAISLATASHMTLGVVRGQAQLSHWKGSAVANASRNAIFCAMLAAKGMTGPTPVFDSSSGYFEALGTPLDFEPLDSVEGTPRIMQSQIKAFPAGTYAQGPGSAAARLYSRFGDASSVREVRVHTTPRGISAMGSGESRWRPETRESADHSLPFVVSIILLEGSLEIRHFDDAYYARPEVRALMDKVRMVPIERGDLGWHVVPSSMVEVELESGEMLSETAIHALGHPLNPMSPAEAERKFRSLATPILPEHQLVRLLSVLGGLEDVKDINDVLSLTVPA